MTKLFTCDNCGATFPNAIDEELVTDSHGQLISLDLCAPCRKLLKEAKRGESFIKKIKKVK